MESVTEPRSSDAPAVLVWRDVPITRGEPNVLEGTCAAARSGPITINSAQKAMRVPLARSLHSSDDTDRINDLHRTKS
jgi:hypothetical protein